MKPVACITQEGDKFYVHFRDASKEEYDWATEFTCASLKEARELIPPEVEIESIPGITAV